MGSKLVFLVRFLLLGWLWLAATAAQAVIVGDLYRTQVPVANQGEAERQQALAQALKNTVRKVSGTAAAAEHPQVQTAAENAQQYVAQFGYVAESGVIESGGGESAKGAGTTLQVSFVPNAINRLLGEAGLPVWGDNRPAVLTWIALEQDGRRELLGSDGASRLVGPLQQQAAERGLPLVIPLMDLEDSSQLSSADVWGFFAEPVKRASTRYTHDAILMGRIARGNGDQWQGHWRLLVQDEQLSGSLTADSSAEVSRKMIDAVADELAARYAVAGERSTAGEVVLEVSDINSLADYAALSQYLASVAPVRSAQPVLAQPDRIRFRLALKGSVAQVQEYFALEKRLRPVLDSVPEVQATESDAPAPLRYRWQP